MYIEKYEPAKSLLLKYRTGEELPKTDWWLAVKFVLAIPVACFLVGKVEATFWVLGLYMLIFGLVLLLSDDVVLSLAADAGRQTCNLDVRVNCRRNKTYHWNYAQIQEIRLQHKRSNPSPQEIAKEKGKDFPLHLTVIYKDAQTNESKWQDLHLHIHDVDTREEFLDFGKRLAQVLHMQSGNLQNNDPRLCEMRFWREAKKDLANPISLADNETPADNETTLAARYAKDEVAAPPILERLVCEEWKPKEHQLSADVVEYVVGKWLVLDPKYKICSLKRYFGRGLLWGFLAASGVFISVGLLFGPRHKFQEMLFYCCLSVLAVGPFVGIVYGIRRRLYRWRHPVFWRLDLVSGELRMHKEVAVGPYLDRPVPLRQAKEIVLRRSFEVRTTLQRTGNVVSQKKYNAYNGQIIAVGLPETPEFVVAETGSFNDEAEKCYIHGLAFAGMLAKSLDLPFRFEDVVPNK